MHLIIDGNNLMHRAYHALGTTDDGSHTFAVIGFVNMVLSAIQGYKPEGVHICWDTFPIGTNKRLEIYDQYKAKRDRDGEIYVQIQVARQVLDMANFCQYYVEGFEADDLLYTLSKQLRKDVIVITNDGDLMQAATETVGVTKIQFNFANRQVFYHKDVVNHYGMYPWQILEYKSLAGDTSDNVPGCCIFNEDGKRNGIGEAWAKKLITYLVGIENIYLGVHYDPGRLKRTYGITQKIIDKLINGEKNARMSRDLCALKDVGIVPDTGYYDLNNLHVAMRERGIAK